MLIHHVRSTMSRSGLTQNWICPCSFIQLSRKCVVRMAILRLQVSVWFHVLLYGFDFCGFMFRPMNQFLNNSGFSWIELMPESDWNNTPHFTLGWICVLYANYIFFDLVGCNLAIFDPHPAVCCSEEWWGVGKLHSTRVYMWWADLSFVSSTCFWFDQRLHYVSLPDINSVGCFFVVCLIIYSMEIVLIYMFRIFLWLKWIRNFNIFRQFSFVGYYLADASGGRKADHQTNNGWTICLA